jgi:hypothetical protein
MVKSVFACTDVENARDVIVEASPLHRTIGHMADNATPILIIMRHGAAQNAADSARLQLNRAARARNVRA